jgi:hypothetical protein
MVCDGFYIGDGLLCDFLTYVVYAKYFFLEYSKSLDNFGGVLHRGHMERVACLENALLRRRRFLRLLRRKLGPRLYNVAWMLAQRLGFGSRILGL